MPLAARDVACWVFKARTVPELPAPGGAPLARCVLPSYRLTLMAAGQPCLLWLSGRQEPGVHAIGLLARPPDLEAVAPTAEVALHRLAEPVPRAELLVDPVFAGAEVIRMPAGSNPSWLAAGQLAVVRDRVDPAVLRAAGWA